jgi:large subunit ribosomal protein L21
MKAVVVSGGKQYVVAEKDQILVDKLDEKDGAKVELDVLMLVDGKNSKVGTPSVGKASAKVIESLVKGDKVQAIRYKAKKRVHKISGSRKQMTRVEIVKIA